MQRRQFLIGGAVTVFGGSSCSCLAADNAHRGCAISGVAARELVGIASLSTNAITQLGVVDKSGNRDFDKSLAETLSFLTDLFNVLPAFSYFKNNSENAYATNANIFGRPDGTVLFGRDLLFQIIQQTDVPEAVAGGICAHEFAHILQFKYKLDLDKGFNSVKRNELHADFLAGFYAGTRKLQNPSFPAAVIAQTHEQFGDHNFFSEQHHGTPKERADAIVAGFLAAFQDRVDSRNLLEVSVRYIKSKIR